MPNGWLTPAERGALKTLAEGREVLEVGAWQGLSAVTMGATAAGLASLDHFQGDADTERVAGPVERARLIDRYLTAQVAANLEPVLLIGDLRQLLPKLDPAAFDLVFYDADHGDGLTMMAVDWAFKGARFAVAVHDYKPQRYAEACAKLDAWQVLIEEMGGARVLVDSLAVLHDARWFEVQLDRHLPGAES